MAYGKFYYIIFPETFIFEVPSWMVRACKKSRYVTELNFELKANVFCRFYFRFTRFYAAFNFRWAYFDSFSWRVHLGVDCARACSEKPFRASLTLTLSLARSIKVHRRALVPYSLPSLWKIRKRILQFSIVEPATWQHPREKPQHVRGYMTSGWRNLF